MWQYLPQKGPAPHSDFLFYIQDLHNQDLDIKVLANFARTMWLSILRL
jgi:hypothetical protein